MAQNPWDRFQRADTTQPPQQAAGGGYGTRQITQIGNPQPSPPPGRDAYGVQDVQTSIQSRQHDDALGDRNANRADAQFHNEVGNQRFGQVNTLVQQFRSDPEIQKFGNLQTAFEGLESLQHQQGNPFAAIGTIYSFMKAMDPGSTVREGEFATAQQAGGIPDSIINAYNNAVGGGRINANQFRQIMEVAKATYNPHALYFNDQAMRYQELLRRMGVPDDEIPLHIPTARAFVQIDPNVAGQGPGVGQQGAPAVSPQYQRPAGGEPAGGAAESDYFDPQTGQLVVNVQGPGLGDQMRDTRTGKTYTLGDAGWVDDQSGQQIGQLPEAPVDPDPYVRTRVGPDISAERGAGSGMLDRRLDSIGRGAMDIFGTGDEMAAALRTLHGDNYNEALAYERAVNRFDERNQTGTRLGAQILASAALPMGNVRNLANVTARTAAYSAAHGFGAGDGDIGTRLLNAGAEGALGAGLGYGLGRLGKAFDPLADARLAARGARPNADGSIPADIAQAAERQGIDLPAPDVFQGRRTANSFLESVPIAGGNVRNTAATANRQIEARVAEAGGQGGLNRDGAGEVIRQGAQRWVDRSRGTVGRLYDRAARLAGNTQITPRQALMGIDRNLQELASAPSTNATKIRLLEQVRADLVEPATGQVRPLSVQAMRDLRTGMRDIIGEQGLRFTDTERRVMGVLDDVNADIRAGLSGGALRAYDMADRAHRARAEIVDNVIEKFLGARRDGSRSSQQIMSAVENAAAPRAGNPAALGSLMSRLKPNEREQVAAHIASTLGRRDVNGQSGFSPATFFSDVMKFDPAARSAIWGRQGAADIADLAVLAEARGGTTGALNNSRSGVVSNWREAIKGLMGIGGGYGVGASLVGGTTGAATAGLTAAGLGGAYLSARAVSNPAIVRALAVAARGGPATTANVVQRLSAIAQRTPALRPDVSLIQRVLTHANDNLSQVRPMAASQPGQTQNEPDPNRPAN